MEESDRLFREYERRQRAERRAYQLRTARFVREDRSLPVSDHAKRMMTMGMWVAVAIVVISIGAPFLTKVIANLAHVNAGL